MRFDRNARGEWLVDPNELARKLGITAQLLKTETALRLVQTHVVMGRGPDEGLSRVRVRYRESIWQGVFDCNGFLINECRLSPDSLPEDPVH
ncbi:hypothetical protein [Methylobacterium nigriterrae]|uniref:hypothetical protein n=1 Tax=Methylobacterium nigriterrae TaxID=3127512 RepID=UPI0030133DE4